jgi:indole-3-glycerol phosphate synthase/phosphoribosylanthranilate isomerase
LLHNGPDGTWSDRFSCLSNSVLTFSGPTIVTVADLSSDSYHGCVLALARFLQAGVLFWPRARPRTALSVGREPLKSRGGDRLLFDNGDGGSGRSFDWSAVGNHPDLGNAIIAGGIGADNAHAARDLGAFAIDVGSSVDLMPGLKSGERIVALFDALRPSARGRRHACA